MIGLAWQLALREWTNNVSKRSVLVILCGVTLVLAVSGPFGTSEALSPFPRLQYWGCVSPATYGLGSFAALKCPLINQ